MAPSISLFDYTCKLATADEADAIYALTESLLTESEDRVHPSVVEHSQRVLKKEIRYYTREGMLPVLYRDEQLVGCAMLDVRHGRAVIEHIVLNDRNSVGSGLLLWMIVGVLFKGKDVYVNIEDSDMYNNAIAQVGSVYKLKDQVYEKLAKAIGTRCEFKS